MKLKNVLAAFILLLASLGMSQTSRADFSFRLGIFDPISYYYDYPHWPVTGHFHNFLIYPYHTYYATHYYSPIIPYYYSYFYYPYYSYYSNYWYTPLRLYSHRSYYHHRYPDYYKRNKSHNHHVHKYRHDHHNYHPHYERQNSHYRDDRQRLQQGPHTRSSSVTIDKNYRNTRLAQKNSRVPLQQNPGHDRSGYTDFVTKADRNNEIAERLHRKNLSTNNGYQDARQDSPARYQSLNQRPQKSYGADDQEQRTARLDTSSEQQHKSSGFRHYERKETRNNAPRMRDSEWEKSPSDTMSYRQGSSKRGTAISMNTSPREENAGGSNNRKSRRAKITNVRYR